MNQEHVTILNIHVPITSTLNFINLDLKTQINFNSVMVGGFIIPILYNGHIIWTKKNTSTLSTTQGRENPERLNDLANVTDIERGI